MVILKVKRPTKFCEVPDGLFYAALREKQVEGSLNDWVSHLRLWEENTAYARLEAYVRGLVGDLRPFLGLQRCHKMANGFIYYKI